jgi:hypothetical protein
MFFNRLCRFAAEIGLFARFWLTRQPGLASARPDAFRAVMGRSTSWRPYWIEQRDREESHTDGMIVLDAGSTSNGQTRFIAEAKPWRS